MDGSDSNSLIYMNARYQNPTYGQFISSDEATGAIGDSNTLKMITQKDTQEFLHDPQGLNAYSYVKNNPIHYTDPTGKQYTDFNGAFTFPIGWNFGVTGGYLQTPGDNSDPYLYVGVTSADRPGPSGSVVYVPNGQPSEGPGVSVSYFPLQAKGAGGQVSFSLEKDNTVSVSAGAGVGSSGRSVSYTITARASTFIDALGGPIDRTSTPIVVLPNVNVGKPLGTMIFDGKPQGQIDKINYSTYTNQINGKPVQQSYILPNSQIKKPN